MSFEAFDKLYLLRYRIFLSVKVSFPDSYLKSSLKIIGSKGTPLTRVLYLCLGVRTGRIMRRSIFTDFPSTFLVF